MAVLISEERDVFAQRLLQNRRSVNRNIICDEFLEGVQRLGRSVRSKEAVERSLVRAAKNERADDPKGQKRPRKIACRGIRYRSAENDVENIQERSSVSSAEKEVSLLSVACENQIDYLAGTQHQHH